MFQRLVLTVVTAISLTMLYGIYSVAIRPVVVVPAKPDQSIEKDEYSEAQRPAENVRVAATYIPASEWAKKSKYMLRAEQAFVFTEHWRQEPGNDKRIRFEKFAVIWVSIDKEGNEQAFSIVAHEALVEFASAFDEKTPNPGRVVRAVLVGDVEISGPDGLSVVGQNFIFDETELNLYTLNPVHFRFQSHRGSASRMTMRLIPAEGLPGRDRPHVYGVQSMSLIANPSLPKNNHVRLEIQMPQGNELVPVNVQCDGDLDYTVATNTAVLTDEVIVQTGAKDKLDRLNCHKLTLQFTPKKRNDMNATVDAKSEDQKKREKEFQQIESDLEFSWLEAEGRQGQQVKIISNSQKAKAYMDRLTYSAETGTLSMSSIGPRNVVTVLQNGSQLKVPTIEAQLGQASGNQISLDSLICLGAGELSYVDDKTGKLAFVATWQTQLSKTTDPETQLDLVELQDKAHFGQPELGTGLIAESIRIWLVPFKISSPAPGDSSAKEPPAPEPKRLLAQRGVALKSPQMQIHRTNELDIRFEDDDIESQAQAATGRQKSRSGFRPASFVTYEDHQVGFANIPVERNVSRSKSTERDSKNSKPGSSQNSLNPSDKPIIVSADKIGVRMRRLQEKQDPELIAVHSEGKVEISQERVPGEKPLELEGDQVDLENQSLNHEIIHIFGSPAKIRDERFKLEGKEIHFNRGENRAWVNGSGWMKFPIPNQAKIPGLEGAANRDLNVHWDEFMNFDGLKAEFVGRVEAKLGLAIMHCEKMEVQLLERLSFQSTTLESNPALKIIHCHENVRFENSTYFEKKLIDKYRGRVGEFEWNHSKGDVIAQGPGEVQLWRRQQKGSSGFAPKDTIQANRPIPVEIAEWDYTRIQFEGKLTGHVDGNLSGSSERQTATIDDRVEVIHGPVRLPNEKVDQDNLPSKAGTMRCDKLQFMNYPKTDRNPVEYRQLIGIGNAEVEGQVDGRRFTASADDISFDGSKGLYILLAHGKRNARLTEIGSSNIAGRRIEFNPQLRSLRGDQVIEGQGSQSQ